MENPTPTAPAASETGIPVSPDSALEAAAVEIDWSQPLELVSSDGNATPVRLCSPAKLPRWVDTNPDADGDFWLLLPSARPGMAKTRGKADESRFCSDVSGDAQPWGTVRNRAEGATEVGAA
ncbi:MAG: hypothetical protein B7Y36_18885 [Novosphingobium sp. 28-62-57]|uniref:hypothetical protein n=1 Tax=unclassified Novosphingobium TaxID=2644732 RepID=UPI000BD6909A|nr:MULTISPECIES: hypothetical protein [unclassified Novosphingobium]OYW50749.1 MAG: hypothetical protein B7Z34_02680 [Novosphingobium sp. 12-62-10]OYZ07784.1 MAG: hypothetical protein B7Y36_18885 [Novosphingobium sp. 28-62-57]